MLMGVPLKKNKKKQKTSKKHRNLFSLLYYVFIYFVKYETIFKSSPSSFGHSGPDPSCVYREQSNLNSQEFNPPLSYTIFFTMAK